MTTFRYEFASESPLWWKLIMVLAALSVLFVAALIILMKVTRDSL